MSEINIYKLITVMRYRYFTAKLSLQFRHFLSTKMFNTRTIHIKQNRIYTYPYNWDGLLNYVNVKNDYLGKTEEPIWMLD